MYFIFALYVCIFVYVYARPAGVHSNLREHLRRHMGVCARKCEGPLIEDVKGGSHAAIRGVGRVCVSVYVRNVIVVSLK